MLCQEYLENFLEVWIRIQGVSCVINLGLTMKYFYEIFADLTFL